MQWIRQQAVQWEQKQAVNFAIAHSDNTVVGSIGLGLVPSFNLAELGYWVGKPYWGKGYATEAARAVVQFGFEKLSLHRIQATHFGNNPASGRVMQKVGMLYEGCRRQHTLKWGEYRDIKLYGMVAGRIGREPNLPSQYPHSTAFPRTGKTVENVPPHSADPLWRGALAKADGG